MKPMVYLTVTKGFAEVTGYDGFGREIDGYRVVYDCKTFPEEILADDGAFASWVFRNDAQYLGNYRKGEKIAAK